MSIVVKHAAPDGSLDRARHWQRHGNIQVAGQWIDQLRQLGPFSGRGD
jgi:hypothetical protein